MIQLGYLADTAELLEPLGLSAANAEEADFAKFWAAMTGGTT